MQTIRTIRLIQKYNILSPIYNSTASCSVKYNCNFIIRRQIYLTRLSNGKIFTEVENAYNYKMLDPAIFRNFQSVNPESYIDTERSFNIYLNQLWREKDIIEIVDAFKKVKTFSIKNNINVSDTRFDKLVDGLMDNCDKLNGHQLIELIQILIEYPMCPGISAHNFHDIWSCLDDISCSKMYNNYNIDELFALADLWYKWNMAKISDYIFLLLDRLIKKADTLSKDQLVRIFFYFAVCRKRNVDFEYEYALQRKIHKMNINELAVIASGYFKSKTKIKTPIICKTMINNVINNYDNVHELSLCSIAKALRHSFHVELIPNVLTMLDKLNTEFNRISNLCCIHLCLLTTTYFLYHENTLRKSIVKLHPDLSTLRLKDLERMLLVLTTFKFPFNEHESESQIFQLIYDELHKDSRIYEIDKYKRVLPAALNYLSLRKIYSFKLCDQVLNKEFWLSFGKGTKSLPREILSIDYCLEIDCPEYTKNRLPKSLRSKAIKWHTEYTPFEQKWKKIKVNDQLFLDTVDAIKQITSSNGDYLFIHHILPHFSKADIVLCKNTVTNKFIKPEGLEKYEFGDVMRPPTLSSLDNNNLLKWYAIVIIGWNNTTRNTEEPLGHILMKERQLKTIGYHPVKIFWHEFSKLTKADKANYIKSKLI